MKKTLSILLVLILVASSIIGVTAAVTKNTAPNPITSNETCATAKSTAKQQVTNNDPVIPDVTGVWKKETNPNGCSIVINNQDGNTLDFTVTSMRGNAAQIATSRINVTLDTEYDGSLVRGYAEFEYVDSFGNGGTGSISVSENAILLVINNEFGPGVWSIANATGDYLLYSNDVNSTEEQQTPNDEVVMPELRSIWKNRNNPNGCSIVINNQDGNTLDFTVTSKRGNAAQIATSNINVTLDTEYDGSLVRGYAEFEYVDSFGNGGTGSISVSENAILLVINNEFGPGVWSIANATGTYY